MTSVSVGPRVAVIGVGYWGRNIARNLAELGSLACVVDIDPVCAHAEAERNGVQPCSYDAVLSNPAIDAVVIATPLDTHFELAIAALRAGKHVMVEKTFTSSFSQAYELVETAKRENRVLMVGHLLHYHPAYLRARDMMRSGKWGELRYVYSNRLAFGLFRGREDAIWGLAAHDASMLLDLTQSEIKALDASGASIDFSNEIEFAHLHLQFENGVRGHIFTSRLHPFKEHRLVIVMDDGALIFEDSASDPARKLMFYNRRLPESNRQTLSALENGVPVEFVAGEPLKAECQHFLDCVATGKKPRTDGAEALRVMRLISSASDRIGLVERSAEPYPLGAAVIAR